MTINCRVDLREDLVALKMIPMLPPAVDRGSRFRATGYQAIVPAGVYRR